MDKMKLGSWDVGMRNLSYCILADGASRRIVEWDNINIVDDAKAVTCTQRNKNGKACTCKARATVHIRGTTHAFCKKHESCHATVVGPELEREANAYTTTAPTTCSYVLKKKQVCCGKRACVQDGEGNPFCGAHHKKRLEEQRKALRLTPVQRVNANTFPIDQLKLNLFAILDQRPQLLQVDEMIIENQPTLKNPRMKSIANALFDYFLMRGIVDRSTTHSTIQKVRFICPSNKLKVEADNTIRTLSKTEDGEKYKMTKALAIKYCTQMIAGDAKHLAFLMAAKKKDDLSDCYLQGIHYLSRKAG